MSDATSQLDKMRQLIAAKKEKSANQNTKRRADKKLGESNRQVTKQHKKGGLFDG